MSLSKMEARRLWESLLAHPGWRLLDGQVREAIVTQVGSTDALILMGMKRVLHWPDSALLSLQERDHGPPAL